MKLSTASLLITLGLANAAPAEIEKRSTVQGFDISNYQATVNFAGAYSSGARFVIIKV
jgi:GH25 family lysozyme M1 (1,4-beta-N-acetylmuramidase)